ncbi:uncharacterized protein LOC123033029 [Varanus komodoensis]|uniref:uncharacterized protein LOC123033029 n=1 Tax=Varanus komodoensis TaxID=61221 RepID=UPI001CF7D694|nr:uncharacterized protein LOC123033029 [Varanus komodoensis]
MKTQQPDIIILQRESVEAPLGSYMPQAIPEFNELMSEFLSDLQPASAMPWKHFAWKKKKRWSSNKTKRSFFKKRSSRFVQGVERRVKSRPADRRDSDSQKFDKSARINLSRRVKRSFSSRKKENSLEDALPNMLKTKEQKVRESRQTGTFRKRRAAEAAEKQLVKTDHLTLTALNTQQKLSEMVARLSDPSNDMTQEEKLSYMRELLNELQLFIQMLQQQILMQSLSEVQDLTTPLTGGLSSRLERS